MFVGTKLFSLMFLFVFGLFGGALQASTTWTTGAYSNNADMDQTLSISDTNFLVVTVSGSTESGYDYVYIYDADGNKIKGFTGLIDETFIVSGSSIRARLTSDYSITRSGVTVTITSPGIESNDTSIIYSNGHFVRTQNKYDIVSDGEGAGNNACIAEYGGEYRIATWDDVTSFLSLASDLDKREFYINLGMKPVGTVQGNNGLSVSSDGKELYSSDRSYYIARHDHDKPDYFLAHKNFNDYEVSLGSWTGSRYVLCYK